MNATRKGHAMETTTAIVVGGGFAGVGCARELARHGIDVTLIDRHNYHQFQPLLYQVATAELATADVARPLRSIFRRDPHVTVRQSEVAAIDPAATAVTTKEGRRYEADYLVLAAGSQPNFFSTPGADEHAFPLYSVADAEQLRSRLFEVFEDADADPRRIDQGALNIVIIGAGATGVETAGAVADLVNDVLPDRYRDLDLNRTRIELIDHGPVVLAPFSDKAHAYTASKLTHAGVHLRLGIGVSEITADRVVLGDGTEIPTRVVVWAGGIKAASAAALSGLPLGRGGRIAGEPDLSVAGLPRVYAVGDLANIPGADGQPLPQLGSVALQSGRWAAKNIVAHRDGKPTTPFRYKDKGMMAMIGRGAAVAEMGSHHHELHGRIAFAAWLGVHAWLLSGVHERVDAFLSWGWDFLAERRTSSIIDDPEAARIDWGDEPLEPDEIDLAGTATEPEPLTPEHAP
jgi:NADH dehydrogenase